MLKNISRIIRVLNLCGGNYKVAQEAVENFIRDLPEPLSNPEDLSWLTLSNKEEDIRLYPILQSQVNDQLKTLNWIVLVNDEYNSLDGDIMEPMGWYSPNAATAVAFWEKLVNTAIHPDSGWVKFTDQAAYIEFKESLKTEVSNKPTPLVALVIPKIIEESDNLKNMLLATYGEEAVQPNWLIRKVLHHELGHHVFPIRTDEYKAYNTDEKIKSRAEAGANLYSWMISDDKQRILLKLITKKQGPAYQAYEVLLTWAKTRVVNLKAQEDLTVGLSAVLAIVFSPLKEPLLVVSCDDEAHKRFPIWLEASHFVAFLNFEERPKWLNLENFENAFISKNAREVAIRNILEIESQIYL